MLEAETVPKLRKALFNKPLLTKSLHYQEKRYPLKENECRRVRQQINDITNKPDFIPLHQRRSPNQTSEIPIIYQFPDIHR